MQACLTQVLGSSLPSPWVIATSQSRLEARILQQGSRMNGAGIGRLDTALER